MQAIDRVLRTIASYISTPSKGGALRRNSVMNAWHWLRKRPANAAGLALLITPSLLVAVMLMTPLNWLR
jgi:hypothetical protein